MSGNQWTVHRIHQHRLRPVGQQLAQLVEFLTREDCSPVGQEAGGHPPGTADQAEALRAAIMADAEIVAWLQTRPPRVPPLPLGPAAGALPRPMPGPGQATPQLQSTTPAELPPSIRKRLRAIAERVAQELAKKSEAEMEEATRALAEAAGPLLDKLLEMRQRAETLTANPEHVLLRAARLLDTIRP